MMKLCTNPSKVPIYLIYFIHSFIHPPHLSLDGLDVTTTGLDLLDLDVVRLDSSLVGLEGLGRRSLGDAVLGRAAEGADGLVVDQREGAAGALPGLAGALVAEAVILLAA